MNAAFFAIGIRIGSRTGTQLPEGSCRSRIRCCAFYPPRVIARAMLRSPALELIFGENQRSSQACQSRRSGTSRKTRSQPLPAAPRHHHGRQWSLGPEPPFARVAGHRTGVKAAREIIETCSRLHLPCLTLYAFSLENWRRPQAEVEFLMRFSANTSSANCPQCSGTISACSLLAAPIIFPSPSAAICRKACGSPPPTPACGLYSL